VFSFGGWGRGSGVLSTHRLMPTADLLASTLRIDVFAGFPLAAPPAGPFSPASKYTCCERLWPGKGTGEPCQPPLGQVQGCVDVPVYPRLARPTPWHPPVFGIASSGSWSFSPHVEHLDEEQQVSAFVSGIIFDSGIPEVCSFEGGNGYLQKPGNQVRDSLARTLPREPSRRNQ
jgi:hypothetical protein